MFSEILRRARAMPTLAQDDIKTYTVTLSGAAKAKPEPRSRTGFARLRCGDKCFCRVRNG